MKALEFNSTIHNNQILIPERMQSELISNVDAKVKVIVLIEDTQSQENQLIRESTQSQFFKGYADSDSIYDNL